MALFRIVPRVLGKLFWVALGVWLIWAIMRAASGDSWLEILRLAAWLPPIGILAVISAQLDLFSSIKRKNLVNIEARMYDGIHWAMLLALNIGVWMREGVPLWWFILTLILVTIIGWQIGVGLQNKWELTSNEKITAGISAVLALLLGAATGLIRYLDNSTFGWGLYLETTTAVVATAIVGRWILLDLKTMRVDTTGYYRRVFLKGLFSNTLVLVFWVHVMTQLPENTTTGSWWLQNLGLTFNVLIGNLIYLLLYLSYERYRKIQQRLQLALSISKA